MVLPRQLRVGAQETSELPNRRRQVLSTLSRGVRNARASPETATFLEPMLRQWVREEVESSLVQFLRLSHNQTECPGARTLQLQFHSNIPHRMFTGNMVLSDDRSPIRVVLYDSVSGRIVTSGPLATLKVDIVVLDSNFGDREDWTQNEFDSNVVRNRAGKRPLMTGELMVTLQNGVGNIGDISFTDNSSWIRSGKFKLGAKARATSESVREGMSNSFRVKDHRGESYQKHYPPSLDDAVWCLEKIAKGGPPHRKLCQNGVCSVGDFLRLHAINHLALRSMFQKLSDKKWKRIITHAETCLLDDNAYLYRAAQGTALCFNSIYKVVGATFDGQSYHSVENFNINQMKLVDDLKQIAYKNLRDWVPVDDPSVVGIPMLLAAPAIDEFNNLQEQDQLKILINTEHPSFPAPFNCEVKQGNSSFEIGESSRQMQGFDFGATDSPIGGHTWAPGGNYVGSQLRTDDIPVEDNFLVESSLWHGNDRFVGPSNHHVIGMIPSGSGVIISKKGNLPRKRWCKVLTVVKWRILVKLNVAARKWESLLNHI